ncbi:DUF2500 domain-containing protein [Gorillibacterium sp. CAU 1737]|uniref:DUF2500 domain-containing protein n=1 Tax=Gorillibacterium sp. CAU 1737 TaxID=3140362 RepID=UPI003260C785
MGFGGFDGPGGFGGMMFTLIPVIVIAGFVIVFGLILFSAGKGISTWSRNNRMPVITTRARLLTKRTDYSHRSDPDGAGPMGGHGSTSYYLTFEMENGERIEFQVNGQEFGLLVEGDTGDLTLQGTRYHSFRRYL